MYGIKFPDGLQPNQELPMGTIITPTTKAKNGLDEELTEAQAREIADSEAGEGTWDEIKRVSVAVFERARTHCREHDLVLMDTKFEFGIDYNGQLMLIDEILTPECSRFAVASGSTTINKNALSNYITKNNADSPIPESIIHEQTRAYHTSYTLLTGKKTLNTASSDDIRQAVLKHINNA